MKLFKLPVNALLALTFACATIAFGQSDRGTIRGTIADPTGAVISGAKVVATSVERGDAREATTGDSGIFVILELKAGLYQVAHEHR